MSLKVPLKKVLFAVIAAVAAGADAVTVIGKAPLDGTITSVTFIPNATITGANTNTRAQTVINKGQSGIGAVNPATIQFNSGVNATGFDEKTIPLSATAADLAVVKGDVIAFNSAHVGTGLADPGGVVYVEFTRSNPAEGGLVTQ